LLSMFYRASRASLMPANPKFNLTKTYVAEHLVAIFRPSFFYYCQGRSKSFPLRRSKRGPLAGTEAPPRRAKPACGFGV
jgi:hypothetical protein